MSNCALRSFSQEDNDDSASSATSTTRGRRRFRRVRASPQQQQQRHVEGNPHHRNHHESPRSQSDVEWIATGMYEVSIRIKEDASRPPQTSISDQALYKEYNNHTDACHNFENDNDESSISSMSSYGTTGDDITAMNTTDSKGEVILIAAAARVQDDTVTTDLSSEERKDGYAEATLHQPDHP